MNKPLPNALTEFVDPSNYQQKVVEMLAFAKQQGATQAEVGLSSSIGLNVSVRKGEVDTLEFNRDKSIGLTVYLGKKKGSASTTDVHPNSLLATVTAAINLAKVAEEDPYAGLAAKEEMAAEILPLDLYHPWDLTIPNAVDIAKQCEQSAFNVSSKIVNSEGATLTSSQGYYIYGNSHGFLGYYPSSRHSLSCVVIAEDKQGMERDYQYTIARNARYLEQAAKVGTEAAERTLARLNARKIPTQKVPVIFKAEVASGILSNFIAAISGGRLFRRSSFLLDSLGKQIFPDYIDIYEEPHLPGAVGSLAFDEDGVATRSKFFIQQGKVTNYLLSAYSARKLGMANTGNASGVNNLFITAGEDDLSALLKKMDKGLLITELMGQGVNLVTGDYSRGATGFWIENGQIQYPVHEITVAGNLKNIFQQLVAVGKDLDRRGNICTGSLLIEEMMVGGA